MPTSENVEGMIDLKKDIKKNPKKYTYWLKIIVNKHFKQTQL